MKTKVSGKRSPSASHLRRLLFGYTSICFVLFAVTLFGFLSKIIYEDLERAEEQNLTHAVEISSIAVEEWFRRAKDTAWQITSRTRIREELQRYNRGEVSLPELEAFTAPKLVDAMDRSENILGMVRMDARRQPVARIGLDLPPDVFPMESTPDSTTASPQIRSQTFSLNGVPAVILSAPILGRENERAGTDWVAFGLSGLLEILNRQTESGARETVWLGKDAPEGPEFFLYSGGGSGGLEDPKSWMGERNLVRKALTPESGLAYANGKIIGYRPVGEGTGWALLLVRHAAEIRNPIFAKFIRLGIGAAAILGVFIFGFWLLMRPLAGRILLRTDELEKRIEEKTRELHLEIAHRKAAEESLRETNRKLTETLQHLNETRDALVHKEKMAVVGQLAAGIAHDFNNILTTLIGYTEVVQMAPETSEALQTDLGMIHAAAKRAEALVKQLLDFSRKSMIAPEPMDLALLVEEYARHQEKNLPENIQLRLEIEDGNFQMEGDAAQIQRVVVNLVGNAADAMPEGGDLDLGLHWVRLAEPEECHACGQPFSGEWLRFYVSDTGAGIPPEILPRIFEPFFTTKEVGKGTGLGLSQVYGILLRHGGHIQVQNGAGKGGGSRFSVFLPKDGAFPEPEAPAEKREEERPGRWG